MGARATTGAAGAGLALLLAACTSPGAAPDPPDAASTTPAASATSSPGPSGTPPAHAPDEPRRLTIALAGDVHFEGVLRQRLQDPRRALAPVAGALSAADLTIVNLETSIGSGGVPEPGKRFTFSAGPGALTALAAAGVDVASMANNHALDFGRGRLPSTFRAIRAAAAAEDPLAVVGIGRDAQEAFAPVVSDVRGTRVATLAASVADQDPTADRTGHWAATEDRPGIADALDPARLLTGVRRARGVADVVVVYLHWGVQGARCPSADQRRLAARLVAAGADVVAGSHAHQLQGDGRLGGGYVAYGLGNHVWYSPGDAATSRTGVLYLTVRPRTAGARPPRVVRAAWAPQRIGADGLPATTTAADATDFRADREALRACAGLAR
ncbi:CapA family protein [Microbacterium sp. ARD31]|uniref:CapA family protein n=1 Tax=Microbacterium sp. ARD31 TaxID=2962576 RepID=UPI002880C001|nr:CapA family protein [Microbacterium sp. ARD31]MDT0187190.1 CapA family protein [Microbacterium sp. ARD31]